MTTTNPTKCGLMGGTYDPHASTRHVRCRTADVCREAHVVPTKQCIYTAQCKYAHWLDIVWLDVAAQTTSHGERVTDALSLERIYIACRSRHVLAVAHCIAHLKYGPIWYIENVCSLLSTPPSTRQISSRVLVGRHICRNNALRVLFIQGTLHKTDMTAARLSWLKQRLRRARSSVSYVNPSTPVLFSHSFLAAVPAASQVMTCLYKSLIEGFSKEKVGMKRRSDHGCSRVSSCSVSRVEVDPFSRPSAT